ncbi:MAG: hypothetical protein HZC28_20325 [Spirochaetes bacterium]|nr:hypothetical protein [Spirochaetota bacterium]
MNTPQKIVFLFICLAMALAARNIQQGDVFRQHEFDITSFTKTTAEVNDNFFSASFSCSPSSYLMAGTAKGSPEGAMVNLDSGEGRHTLTFFAKKAGTYTVWIYASKTKQSTYSGVFYYTVTVARTLNDDEAAAMFEKTGGSEPLSFSKAFRRYGFQPGDVSISRKFIVNDGITRFTVTAKDNIQFEVPQFSYYSDTEGGFLYKTDGRANVELRFSEPGLHAVPIRGRLRGEPEFQNLFTVYCYTKRAVSDEEYEKRFFAGAALPNESVIAEDYQYDYSRIDEYVKNTPKSAEASIDELAAYLAKGARNEREKARAVFKWEQLNLSYLREGPREVNQIFKSRVTQCDGYSKLFLELTTAMGLRAKWVPSHDGKHAYSLVMVDGIWRVLDPTWHMFFTHPKLMIRQDYHYPKFDRFQLMNPRLAVSDYESKNFSVLGDVDVRERIPMSDALAALGMNVADFSHQFKKIDVSANETFTFTAAPGVELMHNIIRTGEKKTMWGTYNAAGGKHSITIRLPAEGEYLMHLWGKKKGTKDTTYLFTYTMRYDSRKKEDRPPVHIYEPVLYQSFDATGRDQSSFKNKVEISGAPAMTMDRFSRRVCAVMFDGLDDYIVVPKERGGNTITGSVSVSVWVKPPAVDGLHGLVTFKGTEKLESDNELWGLYISDGRLLARHENGIGETTSVISESAVPVNKWSHIVLVRDAAKKTYTFYVNGTNERPKPFAVNASGGEHSYLVVGGVYGSKALYRGVLDDVRVYADALPLTEADKLYREGGYPDNLVTISYFPFRRVDASGKQFASMGVVHGATAAADRLGRGGAYAFNGTGDYIESDITSMTGDITLAAWCLAADDPAGAPSRILLAKPFAAGAGNEIAVSITADDTVVVTAGDGKRVLGTVRSPGIERGKWVHIAAVITGQTITVYVNGKAADTATLAGNRATGPGAFQIGRTLGEDAYFIGTIDDVRVYEKALRADEIAVLAAWK